MRAEAGFEPGFAAELLKFTHMEVMIVTSVKVTRGRSFAFLSAWFSAGSPSMLALQVTFWYHFLEAFSSPWTHPQELAVDIVHSSVSFFSAEGQCITFIWFVELLSEIPEEKKGRRKSSIVKVIRLDSLSGSTLTQILLYGHKGHHAERSWRVMISTMLQGLGHSPGTPPPLRS